MKFFSKGPDGGKGSGLDGYYIVEIKSLFSIVVLYFFNNSREAFHEHAFNSWTFWLKGKVREHMLSGEVKEWKAGQIKYTPRTTFHKVEVLGTAWALSLRGPWMDYWREFRKDKMVTLTHGRKEVL